ncbi:hypothetical protein SAMN05216218_1366 [Halorientalis regularis]|jgi:hypothetical protein|uniref:Uncharacterized protein n=1 Tax=Halorientalis regularis TaxID=660518 RepID=A0A1G7U324_9EURY|nr:hypothetical protein SAMN05216218_1366 [Halorientalis regularis]
MPQRVPYWTESPWLYIPLVVALWSVCWVTLETLLFNDPVRQSLVPGMAGGVAFAVATYVARQ